MTSAKLIAKLAVSVGVLFCAFPVAAEDRWAADLYMLRCATCHGADGMGTKNVVPATGPALKGNPFVVNGSENALRNVIRKGRSGSRRLYNDTYPNMPGFGGEAVSDPDRLARWLKEDLQKN